MQIRDPRPINRNNSWNNPQIYLKSQNSGGGGGQVTNDWSWRGSGSSLPEGPMRKWTSFNVLQRRENGWIMLQLKLITIHKYWGSRSVSRKERSNWVVKATLFSFLAHHQQVQSFNIHHTAPLNQPNVPDGVSTIGCSTKFTCCIRHIAIIRLSAFNYEEKEEEKQRQNRWVRRCHAGTESVTPISVWKKLKLFNSTNWDDEFIIHYLRAQLDKCLL